MLTPATRLVLGEVIPDGDAIRFAARRLLAQQRGSILSGGLALVEF